MPGLDFAKLCEELDIEVYKADKNSAMVKSLALAGKEPGRVAKRSAMSTCLKKMYHNSNATWNVISVGDSNIERDALKEVVADGGGNRRQKGICKTVKLRENLTLPALSKELQSLMPSLKELVLCEEDFDRTMKDVTTFGGAVGKMLRI